MVNLCQPHWIEKYLGDQQDYFRICLRPFLGRTNEGMRAHQGWDSTIQLVAGHLEWGEGRKSGSTSAPLALLPGHQEVSDWLPHVFATTRSASA